MDRWLVTHTHTHNSPTAHDTDIVNFETYNTIKNKYSVIYESMLDTGEVKKLPPPLIMNTEGKWVPNNIIYESIIPCTHQFLHPNFALFVDEYISNTDIKKRKSRWK